MTTTLTKALPTTALGFSSALSLLSLTLEAGMNFSTTPGAAGYTYNLYGAMDTTAAGTDPNITLLGTFVAPDGVATNLPPQMQAELRSWPVILIQAAAASPAAQSLYVSGIAGPGTATLGSVAAPASGLFSGLIDLSAFSGSVRIGGSKAMTSSDQFTVYVTNDSTDPSVSLSPAGAWIVGPIVGGGSISPPASSVVIPSGWKYAFVKRTSGSTAGTIKAAATNAQSGGGQAWVQGGNSFGATGVLGTDDAFSMTLKSNGTTFLTSTSTQAITIAASTFQIAATSVVDISSSGAGVNLTGTTQLTLMSAGATTATLDVSGAGTINVGCGNQSAGKSINVGRTTGVDSTTVIGSGFGGSSTTIQTGTGTLGVGSNATDHTTTLGSITGASPTNIVGGTTGVAITATGIGPIALTSGTGASTWAVGAGGSLGLSSNATDHSTTLGSITGASPLALRAGTGGLTIVNNGVTWTWPTAVGAAGTKLTDAAGNGVLSFA